MPDTILQQLQALVAPLIELGRVAGDAICRHYFSDDADSFQSKRDDSPLTHADLDSHKILLSGLSGLAGSIPVLSEESPDVPSAERMSWPRYWLVDPLDGTREFLDRTGEFTINVALIDQHVPVLGMLYLPLKHRAYIGIPGVEATCYQRQETGRWESRALRARRLKEGEPLTVLASRRHQGPKFLACRDWLAERWQPLERRDSGSALKFCQLAEGEGDVYPRFSPCCEWDTAAGQALVEAAGGAILGLDGNPLRYNCSDSLYSPNFFALADACHPLWQPLLNEKDGV